MVSNAYPKHPYWWLTSLFCLLFVSLPVSAETIKISTGEWPPWVSADLKHYGLSFRIIEAAFAEENVDLEVVVLTWSKAYDEAKAGKFDATGIWFYSDERNNHFIYSDPVVHAGFSFFYRTEKKFDWKSLDDLKGLKVGATLGYTYPEQFFQAEEKGVFTVDWVPTDLINLNKLMAGSLDIFPCDVEVGYFLLQKHFGSESLSKISHAPKPLRADPLSLLFPRSNPKSQEWQQTFNKGLKKVRSKKMDIQFYEESRKGMYLPD